MSWLQETRRETCDKSAVILSGVAGNRKCEKAHLYGSFARRLGGEYWRRRLSRSGNRGQSCRNNPVGAMARFCFRPSPARGAIRDTACGNIASWRKRVCVDIKKKIAALGCRPGRRKCASVCALASPRRGMSGGLGAACRAALRARSPWPRLAAAACARSGGVEGLGVERGWPASKCALRLSVNLHALRASMASRFFCCGPSAVGA